MRLIYRLGFTEELVLFQPLWMDNRFRGGRFICSNTPDWSVRSSLLPAISVSARVIYTPGTSNLKDNYISIDVLTESKWDTEEKIVNVLKEWADGVNWENVSRHNTDVEFHVSSTTVISDPNPWLLLDKEYRYSVGKEPIFLSLDHPHLKLQIILIDDVAHLYVRNISHALMRLISSNVFPNAEVYNGISHISYGRNSELIFKFRTGEAVGVLLPPYSISGSAYTLENLSKALDILRNSLSENESALSGDVGSRTREGFNPEEFKILSV